MGDLDKSAYQKGASAAATITSTGILNMLLSMAIQIAIASHFGLGSITDAYLFSLSLIVIIAKFFRIGSLPSVYVSVFSKENIKKDSQTGLLFNNLLHINVFFFGGATVLLFLSAPLLVKVLVPGFEASTKMETIRMFRLLLPLVVYHALSGLMIASFHARNQFHFPAVIQLLPILTVCVIGIYGLERFGIYGFIYGNLAGSLLHLLVLYWGNRRSGQEYQFVFELGMPAFRRIVKLITPYYVGGLGVQLGEIVQNVLLSMLPAGSLSALVYARRFKNYMVNYLFNPFSVVIYPTLCRKVEQRGGKGVSEFLAEILRLSNFVVFPMLILLAIMSTDLIKLLFYRGAFDATDLSNVSIALTLVAIGALPCITNSIWERYYLAIDRTKWINVLKVILQLFLIVTSIILFGYLGLVGLVVAMAILPVVEFILNCIYLKNMLDLRRLFTDVATRRVFLNGLLTAVFLFSFYRLYTEVFPVTAFWGQVFQILLIGGAGLFFHLFTAYLLRVPEFKVVQTIARERIISLVGTKKVSPI
jgi:putative peptidoglycan lipid II flippase